MVRRLKLEMMTLLAFSRTFPQNTVLIKSEVAEKEARARR